MPSGKTHDFLTFLFVPLIGLIFYYLFPKDLTVTFLAVISFLFGGLMFSGDLDLKSKPYKRWGIFKFIWIPYRKMVTHRSPLSHNILIGTLFRLAYFGLVMFLFVSIAVIAGNYFIGRQWDIITAKESKEVFRFLSGQSPVYIGAVFSGIFGGAALHTISDIVWSSLKKLRF